MRKAKSEMGRNTVLNKILGRDNVAEDLHKQAEDLGQALDEAGLEYKALPPLPEVVGQLAMIFEMYKRLYTKSIATGKATLTIEDLTDLIMGALQVVAEANPDDDLRAVVSGFVADALAGAEAIDVDEVMATEAMADGDAQAMADDEEKALSLDLMETMLDDLASNTKDLSAIEATLATFADMPAQIASMAGRLEHLEKAITAKPKAASGADETALDVGRIADLVEKQSRAIKTVAGLQVYE